ncbi:hypothetical protein D9M72_390510 [compost metagenome]
MNTPAQLHRSRRNTLTIKGHRLRRRTIQRLLQQRLLRRHRNNIRRRTGLLQLRIPRVLQIQPTTARQEQLPPPRIQDHRLIPHHRQLQITGTLQPVPRARLRRHHLTIGINSRHSHNTRLRIRTVNPVIRPDSGHQTLRTDHGRFSSFLIEAVHRGRRKSPHLALGRIRHRNHGRTETNISRTRQLLIPAQLHIRRRDLIQSRAGLIINENVPGVLQDIERSTRRRHRTVEDPRRIIQPPNSVLGLTDHPHTAVVQLHLSGLEPRINNRTSHQSSTRHRKSGARNQLSAAIPETQLAEQSSHKFSNPSKSQPPPGQRFQRPGTGLSVSRDSLPNPPRDRDGEHSPTA